MALPAAPRGLRRPTSVLAQIAGGAAGFPAKQPWARLAVRPRAHPLPSLSPRVCTAQRLHSHSGGRGGRVRRARPLCPRAVPPDSAHASSEKDPCLHGSHRHSGRPSSRFGRSHVQLALGLGPRTVAGGHPAPHLPPARTAPPQDIWACSQPLGSPRDRKWGPSPEKVVWTVARRALGTRSRLHARPPPRTEGGQTQLALRTASRSVGSECNGCGLLASPAAAAGSTGASRSFCVASPQGPRDAPLRPRSSQTPVLGYRLPLPGSQTRACPGHVNLARGQGLESYEMPLQPEAGFERESAKGHRAGRSLFPSRAPFRTRASASLFRTAGAWEPVSQDAWAPGLPDHTCL